MVRRDGCQNLAGLFGRPQCSPVVEVHSDQAVGRLVLKCLLECFQVIVAFVSAMAGQTEGDSGGMEQRASFRASSQFTIPAPSLDAAEYMRW